MENVVDLYRVKKYTDNIIDKLKGNKLLNNNENQLLIDTLKVINDFIEKQILIDVNK